MLAEGVPPITSDEGLVNFANCALKMLREAPRILRANEVSDDFLSEVALILFGSDTIPFLRPCNAKHRQENIAAILAKLSQEIDLELDHISPVDVVSGDRKAVSNILELLTAFILHCVHEDLLDFDRANASCRSCHRNSGYELGATHDLSRAHLSVSPEIPRASFNRGHTYAVTPAMHHADTAQTVELGKPLQVLINSPSVDRYGRTICSPAKADFPAASTSELTSQEPPGRSSSTTMAVRLTPLQRLHPYFSNPSDDSPPATPKGADDLVEIIKHQSPPTVPPSLHCSPVLNGSETHAPEVSCSRNRQSLSSNHWVAMNDALTRTSSNSILSPAFDQSSSALSDPDSDSQEDVSDLKETAIPLRRLGRKTSSSSSGRGHSPTQTLTAPGASVTTTPPSLSDSPPPPSLPVPPPFSARQAPQMAPRDVACQTVENTVPKSPRVRQKPSILSRHARNVRSDVLRGSCTSVATTDSILAWSTEHHSHLKPERNKNRGSSTASVLSSSFLSKPNAQGRVGPSPSASVLFAHTEGFSQALKRRLDYLRTIFSRAHDEAEAVGQLVQLIGSQHVETLEFMDQCLRRGKTADQFPAAASTLYSYKPLEQMVQRILAGIEILLRRHDSAVERSPVRRQPSSTRLRSPLRRHRPTNRSNKSVPSPAPITRSSRSTQFEELMEMKHSLMSDTLTWLRSELESKGRSPSSMANASNHHSSSTGPVRA